MATEETPLVRGSVAATQRPGHCRQGACGLLAAGALATVMFSAEVHGVKVRPAVRRVLDGQFKDIMYLRGGGTDLLGVAQFAAEGFPPQAQPMGEGDGSEKGGHYVPYPNPMQVFLTSVSSCVATGLPSGAQVAVYADVDLSGWAAGAKLTPAQIFPTFSVNAEVPGASAEELGKLRQDAFAHCPILRVFASAEVNMTGSWQAAGLGPVPPENPRGERMTSMLVVGAAAAAVHDADNGANSVPVASDAVYDASAGAVSSPTPLAGLTTMQQIAAGITYCVTENAQFVALNMSGGEKRKVASSWAYTARLEQTVALAAGFNTAGGWPAVSGATAADIILSYSLQVSVQTSASADDVAWVAGQAVNRCPLIQMYRYTGVQNTISFTKA
eukprot:TRINITY_DN39491_c0_g1_i1.p1 TRINITY_DN39491_c0_g1~~TRINITY_DN39491_c0_g1_i1.p1  ORF type:complete len:403 (+),score=118.55 TRINITY_DN39491_c0_g1_i1:54-1211(+)